MTKPIVTQQAKLGELLMVLQEAEKFNANLKAAKKAIAIQFFIAQINPSLENLDRLWELENEAWNMKFIDTDSIQKEIEKLIKDN